MRRSPAVLVLGLFATLGALSVYALQLGYPLLFDDDFQVLTASWTWADTVANLWTPHNEHTMPSGRLSTWLLIQLTSSAATVANVVWQGPLLVLVNLWLTYFFVCRELGHRLYGLLALLFVGISVKYHEAVRWFTASFALYGLACTLLALLAAQSWRQTGRKRQLAWCILWSAVAPSWFASGILAGPFCCLYLLPREDGRDRSWRSRLTDLVPLLGTAAFLLISLPLNYHAIQHTAHYDGRTALEASNLWVGLVNTGRALIDLLVLTGVFSFTGSVCPLWLVPVILVGFACAGRAWWRRAPQWRLLLLGLGFILVTYLLTFTARASWAYEQMASWTRYNVFAWPGLVLFVLGGLPCREGAGKLFVLQPDGQLSRRQVVILSLLVCCLTVAGIVASTVTDIGHRPAASLEQRAVLQQIAEVETLCRLHHISAADARRALDPLVIPSSGGAASRTNAWEWLRGSDQPWEYSVEEVRRLLSPQE